jgi:exopolyphosphatase / guanosine-5'-triphosphate,3'-diphosphate pyrophosphatase
MRASVDDYARNMRLGVLDVGSNTVHLLVVDAHRGARPIPTASEKSVLRLMRYLEPDGAISEVGIRAIVDAVAAAADAAGQAGLDELLAFATSAIREAANGEAVLDRVADETGVRLSVLSGEEEAHLTFLAVRRWYGWSADRILVFDIGGGSLELVQGLDEVPDVARSLPLGAGRSTIEFLPDDPPSTEQVARLRAHARAVIAEAMPAFRELPSPDHVVGSSKTIRSLARLAGTVEDGVGASDRSVLTRRGLDDWTPRLAKIPADARPALPGITADRTFQIVAGAVVLSEAMRAFGVDELEVSPWALREGLILRRLDRLA